MQENASNGLLSFLGLLVLATAVVWLAIAVFRLRMEALINRRVIASLQKVRPIVESKSGGEKVAQLVRQTILAMVALLTLLLLYDVAGR